MNESKDGSLLTLFALLASISTVSDSKLLVVAAMVDASPFICS